VQPEIGDDVPDRTAPSPARWSDELLALDRAVYAAVAGTPTPHLDRVLRPLTSAADHSKLWLGTAAVLAVAGGRPGRRAALHGIAAIGMASAVVNQPLKRATRRRRPDRDTAAVPESRRVPMPTSTSFPSGHSASAFAFAQGVGHTLPALGVALRLAAAAVAYSRVHSGVHYPGDVLIGVLAGVTSGEAAPRLVEVAAARRASLRLPAPGAP
jgi:undecaprenyl-diphosphatase